MDPAIFQEPAWYQSLTLTERIVSPHAIPYKTQNGKLNPDRAKRRMQRWQSQPPFTTGTYFAQRLEMDGVTEDEFLYLLGEPIEAVSDRTPVPPAWLAELASICSSSIPFDAVSVPEKVLDQEISGFLNIIEPLIHQGCDRIHEGVQALIQTETDLPFDPDTVEELLFANLPERLLILMSRTLTLELNIARLLGLLKGETDQERFLSFLQRLRQPEVSRAILQEYPVLARRLTNHINQWVTFNLEFLGHLCADWEAIRAAFSPEDDPGILVQLEGDAGDPHRGGRSVMIAKFSAGLQVVYKPRPLAVDVHFQQLLLWLNERGDHPPLRTLRILDRGTYGWAEFVHSQSCTSLAEVQRFYQRQGSYLGLLYLLQATDFFADNIIATGEHPILVDLETLFHPRVEEAYTRSPDFLAGGMIDHSVVRTGLLPQRMWANDESEGVDISGLGRAAGQLTPNGVIYWDGAGTDQMKLARKQVEMSVRNNRPTLNGNEVNLLDYAEEIVGGFSKMYRLFLRQRADLLSEDGPLACFAEDEVRVLLRPTALYDSLLDASCHPDMLRDALECDRLFDRLWVGIQYSPSLAQVFPAEREDLQKGDIPIFTTRPTSCDLWTSSNQRIANFFDKSSMDYVQDGLRQLSNDDLVRQIWFIRASLATLSKPAEQTPHPIHGLTEPQTVPSHERLLTAARAVADRLEATALWGENEVTWVGVIANRGNWVLDSLSENLYDGLSGVALFLAYLGAITGEQRYTTLGEATLTTILTQIEGDQSSITSIGGFEGWGGTIYTLVHLGTLWERPDLLVKAQNYAKLLPTLIEQSPDFDLLSGAAGCIGGLISLYHTQPSEHTLAAAIQCGDQLISHAQQMEHGAGWTSAASASVPLTGFSHGSAGIAWALLVLASVSGQERFRQTALNAIAYERSLFSTEEGNWQDLRSADGTEPNAKVYEVAWCHGAPGIGLARLHISQHLHDPEIRTEIDTALNTTRMRGFGMNHSLCHGDLGNLELLLQASQMLDDKELRTQTYHIAAKILESIDQQGWLCGVPLHVETPGLMTGLAGIGYGLLRLAAPERVPSVLTLEPPRL